MPVLIERLADNPQFALITTVMIVLVLFFAAFVRYRENGIKHDNQK